MFCLLSCPVRNGTTPEDATRSGLNGGGDRERQTESGLWTGSVRGGWAQTRSLPLPLSLSPSVLYKYRCVMERDPIIPQFAFYAVEEMSARIARSNPAMKLIVVSICRSSAWLDLIRWSTGTRFIQIYRGCFFRRNRCASHCEPAGLPSADVFILEDEAEK